MMRWAMAQVRARGGSAPHVGTSWVACTDDETVRAACMCVRVCVCVCGWVVCVCVFVYA